MSAADRPDLLDSYRRECKAWANGVADLADEFIGTYDRYAACGPADLLPALEDVAQLLRLSTDPVLVTLREALAEQRAASDAYEALSGFEDVEVLEAGAQRLVDAQEASVLARIAARSPR